MTFGAAQIVPAILLALLPWPALATIGADFGARDPAICPLRDLPIKGGPSFQQALRFLACDMERVGDHGSVLYLLGEVRLSVSSTPRAYDPAKDTLAVRADPSLPVYPISGDFRIYQCQRKSSPEWLANPGHACRYQNFYQHAGLCWKDMGGDWHCALAYRINPAQTVHSVAPPKAGNYLAIGASAPPPAGASKSSVKKRKKHHR